MFTSLLDTCVLWPSKQRDFLLSLAVEGLYRPVWSSAVLEELGFHEARKRIERGSAPDDAATLASSLIQNMRRAFIDSEVVGWEALEGTYGLPDADDEHVVAAAVIAGAGSIVTLNTKDFPRDLMPKGISVVSPADFAWETVNLSPTTALHAVEEMASRSGRNGPKETADEILDVLVSRYGMAEAVHSMRSLLPQHEAE